MGLYPTFGQVTATAYAQSTIVQKSDSQYMAAGQIHCFRLKLDLRLVMVTRGLNSILND